MNNVLQKLTVALIPAFAFACQQAPPKPEVPKLAQVYTDTAITFEKISEGYEVIIFFLDKDMVDKYAPLTPSEVAKLMFCKQERAFPPENVQVLPLTDPAYGPYMRQVVHKSNLVIARAEVVDEEAKVLKLSMKEKSREVYFRLLLGKRKTQRLVNLPKDY